MGGFEPALSLAGAFAVYATWPENWSVCSHIIG